MNVVRDQVLGIRRLPDNPHEAPGRYELRFRDGSAVVCTTRERLSALLSAETTAENVESARLEADRLFSGGDVWTFVTPGTGHLVEDELGREGVETFELKHGWCISDRGYRIHARGGRGLNYVSSARALRVDADLNVDGTVGLRTASWWAKRPEIVDHYRRASLWMGRDVQVRPRHRFPGVPRKGEPRRSTASTVVESKMYDLPDPELRAYDHGLGVLSVAGELKGYLASSVGEIIFPSRGQWPWFVVVWPDGTKENPFEDYGPSWWTVRQLDAGYLDHYGPSIMKQGRFLGRRFTYSQIGPPVLYDFAWLSIDEAAATWSRLGLTDSDF